MNDFQFLKEEISNKNFNKRIFYARNANKYIPYIANYILKDENSEEVLTEYSKTFLNFLKYLGKENIYQNYQQQINNNNNISNKENQDIEDEKNSQYNKSISLLLKCFFEKFFISEDEILTETAINNMKELLLELHNYSLIKNEMEKCLNNISINISTNENKDINDENEVFFLIFSLLYPIIENNEQKIDNYCNKFKTILKNNNQLKKKRLIIQNITNIIPFIKKAIDNIKENTNKNDDNNNNQNIKGNIFIIKEILFALNNIMDDKHLIISEGMNYLCEIIIIYTIKNITDIILFYDEYSNILSNQEINTIVDNFLAKLENFINNESVLNISLTWRIKVAYIENICRLNKLILKHNPNYFNDYFSFVCQKILEKNNNNEIDLTIAVLNHVEYFIPKITTFIKIFNNMSITESNTYVHSGLGKALNKIINSQQLYELNISNLNDIISDIFNIIQHLIEKEKFEVKYHLFSSFEFDFFNLISNDNYKIIILNKTFKILILAFETINEWRIRYNIYNKTEKFLSNEENFLKILTLYEKDKNNNNEIVEIINNLRYLIQLFFKDKANIIRINCLTLINNLINLQKKNNIKNESWLIRIKEELIKYQISLFCKSYNLEENENIINNITTLEINKNYSMKLFFLDSVKTFINLYSKNEKNIIKDIVGLIKNDKKYSKENIANNKINNDVEAILGQLIE